MEQKNPIKMEQELVAEAYNFQLQEAETGEWNMDRLDYTAELLMKKRC